MITMPCRHEIWRSASDNIDRERVSANVESALTQVVFGKKIIKSAVATVICAACWSCIGMTADKKLKPLASIYDSGREQYIQTCISTGPSVDGVKRSVDTAGRTSLSRTCAATAVTRAPRETAFTSLTPLRAY
jgi:hypothetical protein